MPLDVIYVPVMIGKSNKDITIAHGLVEGASTFFYTYDEAYSYVKGLIDFDLHDKLGDMKPSVLTFEVKC